jgi:hypothetical protein
LIGSAYNEPVENVLREGKQAWGMGSLQNDSVFIKLKKEGVNTSIADLPNVFNVESRNDLVMFHMIL